MPEIDCLVGRFATLGRKLVGAWWSGSCVSGIAGILASRLVGASYVGLHRVDASRVEGFGCCCVWRVGKMLDCNPRVLWGTVVMCPLLAAKYVWVCSRESLQ